MRAPFALAYRESTTVIVPRLFRPLVRSRARLAGAVAALLIVTSGAAGLLWWQHDSEPGAPGAAAPPVPRDEAAAFALAKSSGAEVLVDTATTETSQTWIRPDGQARTVIHALPQRSRAATGSWASIDTTLTRGPGGIKPKNPVFPVRFAGHSGGSSAAPSPTGSGGRGGGEAGESVLAEATIGGHKISYTWPGPLPEPVLDGVRALYPDALPGVDVLMVARVEGGFSQLLIVKTPAAAELPAVRTPTYGLASDTVIFRHDPATKGVRVLDKTTGAEITTISTPFGWDAAGLDVEAPPGSTPHTSTATPADVLRLSALSGMEPGAHSAVLPTLLQGDGTGDARLSLDVAGTGLLTDPQTRYPVILDPTLNSGRQAWALVQKLHPNSNFLNGTNYNGGTSEARVGHEDETNGTARSFWRMGYANLNGAKISSAKFKVLNTHSWNCTVRQHQLWLTGAIGSATTWNKQPSWSRLQQKKSFAYGYNGSCNDDYVDFNVADAAQYAANNSQTSITLGMRATTETDTLTWRKFTASSAALEVVYNRPPREPTGGTQTPGGACKTAGIIVAKTRLVLAAASSDPDGNLSKLRFRFWKSGATVPAGTLVTTTSVGQASLPIESSALVDKGVYFWDVRAEDTSGAVSSYYPPGDLPCKLTVDASAPPAPDIVSDVFLEATDDGATWATVKFGQTGPVTFIAESASRFAYQLDNGGPWTYVNAVKPALDPSKPADEQDLRPRATVPNVAPAHAGPTWINAFAYDAAGNLSQGTQYNTYVQPRDLPDGAGDINGDGINDLLTIYPGGGLFSFAGGTKGDLSGWLHAAYNTAGTVNPSGHWEVNSVPALISKHSDTYPGDGNNDVFARTPDGSFWVYPGDGYGSFNVDKRLKVLMPSTVPHPNTWIQVKAVGDLTGDQRPEIAVRSGTQLLILGGYTGASVTSMTAMDGNWSRLEILNIADVDLDGTPDLTFRNLDTGALSLRYGKPGAVAGTVDLNSLKNAAASRTGSDFAYGKNWNVGIDLVIGVPDQNGDRVPDIYARITASGQIRLYYMTPTGAFTTLTALDGNYNSIRALG